MALRHCVNPKGYISLVTVMVVGAVSASIAATLLLIGIGTARSSGDAVRGAEARAYANACAETALLELWNNAAYTGTGSLSLGNGTCTYTVSSGPSVAATGTSGEATRRLTVDVASIATVLTLSSWQETP